MKKFTAIFAMLAIAAVTFGQVQDQYFAGVGWSGPQEGEDWGTTPYAKAEVIIKQANENYATGLDMDEFTAAQLVSFWDRLGEENFCANHESGGDDATSLDALYNLDGDGTFGASWKAFYNEDALFVIIKFIDADQITTNRWAEVMLQTGDPIRFDAGYDAAPDLDTKNEQYARFIELGGMKIKYIDGAISENVANIGAQGAWGGHPSGTAFADLYEFDGGNNDAWAVLELPFSGLTFYSDPWDDQTTTAMDPTVQTQIGFDVSPRASHSSLVGEYRAFWNSEYNNVYYFNAYAGLLTFGDEVFDPVGFETKTVSGKSAYIYNDFLKLKGFDDAVDVEVYSIVGKRVMTADNVSSELNVSGLNSGVYVVKVKGEKEAFKVLK